MATTSVTIELDLPEGVEVREYQRHSEGHAFHVAWPLPDRCHCNGCAHEGPTRLEYRSTFYVVRDLDVWSQPRLWVYQPPLHHCPRRGRRQRLLPPFKRRDVTHTYRFERHVLACLIGSTEEEVAQRLGISAETVTLIVANQIADQGAKQVSPGRVIRLVGLRGPAAEQPVGHRPLPRRQEAGGGRRRAAKKVTRGYKRELNKEQRKQFRARMWEFRRRPQDLMTEPAEALEALFEEVPALRVIYQLRWKLTGIFDEAADRGTTAAGIAAWCAEAETSGQDWSAFVGLYERHRDDILAYFEGRQTSGPVEGLNNKARVIIKRSYGLKSCDTLWTRLILDVNWVRERIGRTVEATHALANRIWWAFFACYT